MRPTVFLLFSSLFMPGVGQAQSAGGGNGAASELSETASEADPQTGSDSTTQTVRYIAPAVAMDLGLFYGGIGLLVMEEMGVDGLPPATGEVGLVLAPASLFLGGVVTHSIYRNPEARLQSVGLRLKYSGLGGALGAGAGVGMGLVMTGVCGLAGGGYCPLALVYGLVGGTGIGLAGGLVWGMVLDYKTLARKEIPLASAAVRPTLRVSPQGDVQLGVVGRF